VQRIRSSSGQSRIVATSNRFVLQGADAELLGTERHNKCHESVERDRRAGRHRDRKGPDAIEAVLLSNKMFAVRAQAMPLFLWICL